MCLGLRVCPLTLLPHMHAHPAPCTSDLQAPIRMEQLKGLVRKWKLHHERNFWRNHPSTEDVVNACHKHLKEKKRWEAGRGRGGRG